MNISVDNTLDVQLSLIKSVLKTVKVGTIVLDSEQRIVLWNQWMEQHSPYSAEEVIGKFFIDVFPDMLNGRTHAAIKGALIDHFSSLISQTLNKAPFPLYVTPTDAVNGIRMQQAVQVMPVDIEVIPLIRHCLVQITDVSMAVAHVRQLREKTLTLQSQTFSDELTGIANRRRFDKHMEDEFRRAKRSAVSLSLVMIDVDYFKAYNDNYGHQRGDQCLVQIAAALTGALRRPCDLVARYGGEEFIAVLPDTNTEGALKVADAMRIAVELLGLEHAYSPAARHITISLGTITQIPGHTTAMSHLIDAADRALYQAKRSGRNCVVAYDDSLRSM